MRNANPIGLPKRLSACASTTRAGRRRGRERATVVRFENDVDHDMLGAMMAAHFLYGAAGTPVSNRFGAAMERVAPAGRRRWRLRPASSGRTSTSRWVSAHYLRR